MDYLIEAIKDGRPLLGSANSAIVRDAKSMIKVKNRLKWFTPNRAYDEIRVYYFTSLYDEKTHKLVMTTPITNHVKSY